MVMMLSNNLKDTYHVGELHEGVRGGHFVSNITINNILGIGY